MENLFTLAKGKITPQAHVGLPQGTYEEEFGRDGFFGRVSHLYHAHSPTGWTRIEGPLRPEALRAQDLPEATDPRALPVSVLENADVRLKIYKPAAPMPFAFRNADGDDLFFIHQGTGRIETDFGPLTYEPGDYVLIPRGTTYRLTPDAGVAQFHLVIESPTPFGLPDKGMLGRQALFDAGVVKTPSPAPTLEAGGREWEVLIQRQGRLTKVFYPFDPIDVVGWKGDLTVFQLNVRDFRPVMSHRYHLPPSVHTTFLAKQFVVCTFAPRPIESDPEALKVPFFHRNIDFDEVLFYHAGDFFSRDGIEAGMFTWHPQGIHHGPHPKALANQGKKQFTDEYAVMVDTKNPLELTEAGRAIAWADYWASWGAAEHAGA